MEQTGNRVLTSQLAEDLGWLETHSRQNPQQSLQTIQLRLAAALVRTPRLAGELWRLAGQTRTAARRLALALGEVLTLTLPWAEG